MTTQDNNDPRPEEEYQVIKERYICEWRSCLITLLGWPEKWLLKWEKKWERGLDGGGMFYHETSMYYTAPLMIPDSLTAQFTFSEYLKFMERIMGAMEPVVHWDAPIEVKGEAYKNFNWNDAKQRVEAILNEYGETLESVQYPTIVKKPIANFDDIY